jgi:hypothetical protein
MSSRDRLSAVRITRKNMYNFILQQQHYDIRLSGERNGKICCDKKEKNEQKEDTE